MAIVKKVKKAQSGVTATKDSSLFFNDKVKNEKGKQYNIVKSYKNTGTSLDDIFKSKPFKKSKEDELTARDNQIRQMKKGKPGFDANGFPLPKKKKAAAGAKLTKAKAGKEMIKRADGSFSQRGLWDNIRAAKGSGKKPTAQMLKQEKKIKAKSK